MLFLCLLLIGGGNLFSIETRKLNKTDDDIAPIKGGYINHFISSLPRWGYYG